MVPRHSLLRHVWSMASIRKTQNICGSYDRMHRQLMKSVPCSGYAPSLSILNNKKEPDAKFKDLDRRMGSYEAALESLNDLLKKKPELKSIAAKKIEEIKEELICEKEEEKEAGDALEKIRKGFEEFKAYFKKEHTLFKALAESQHPKFMIIACADSRVDPALTLGFKLGEAFVVRNIASLVPPKDSPLISVGSAIEYAVLHLKVEHLMVIGHSRCGGIKALLGMKDDGSNRFSDHIEDWITVGNKASKSAKAKCSSDTPFEEQWTCCVKDAVNVSLWNCMTYPFVKNAVQNGTLGLHGAYFDFVNGAFEHWNIDYETTEPKSS